MSDEIGAQIQRRRRDAGLSLEALSQKSGVSPAMLSEIERGKKNPTVKLAYQVARALGCTLSDLIGEETPPFVQVQLGSSQRVFRDRETGIERRGQQTLLAGGRLELAWYALPPLASTGTMGPNRAGLLERIDVLEGELVVALNDVEHRLAAGDAITYGVQTTEYRNPSAEASCRFALLSDASRCAPS